jgi:hypothetical protein
VERRAVRAGIDGEVSAHRGGSSTHVAKAITAAGRPLEAATVVLQLAPQPMAVSRHTQRCVSRCGVFGDVGDGFLQDQIQMPALIRAQTNGRGVRGRRECQGGTIEHVGRVIAHPLQYARDVIAPRVDGPDHVARGIDQAAGRLAKVVQPALRVRRQPRLPLDDFAQDRDARQRAADIVVQVGGDAHTHALHRDDAPEPLVVQAVHGQHSQPAGSEQKPPPLSATVRNNVITGNRNRAIHATTLEDATAASLLQVRIEHNTIGTPGVFDSGGGFLSGILVEGMGDARVIGLVSDNEFHEVADGSAIEVRRRYPSTAAAQPMDFTVTNNVVTVPTGTNINNPSCAPGLPCPSASIFLSAHDQPGFPVVLNAHVSGNTAYDPNHEFTLPKTEGAYRLEELDGGTLQLVVSGDAATLIASTNTVSPPSPTGVRVDAGVTVIPGPIVTPP